METSIKEQLTEFARVRTFLYFYIASFIIFIGVIFEELGPDFHELDDILFIALAFIAIVIIIYRWKNRSLSGLRLTNNISALIAFLLVLVSIYAISIEMGDTADFGDEIPQLLLSIIILISRFIL